MNEREDVVSWLQALMTALGFSALLNFLRNIFW